MLTSVAGEHGDDGDHVADVAWEHDGVYGGDDDGGQTCEDCVGECDDDVDDHDNGDGDDGALDIVTTVTITATMLGNECASDDNDAATNNDEHDVRHSYGAVGALTEVANSCLR